MIDETIEGGKIHREHVYKIISLEEEYSNLECSVIYFSIDNNFYPNMILNY